MFVFGISGIMNGGHKESWNGLLTESGIICVFMYFKMSYQALVKINLAFHYYLA
jgi:hypothetical protein